MKYKKKPVIVEAIQWTGNNTKEILDFCPIAIERKTYLCIPTLEGNHFRWTSESG